MVLKIASDPIPRAVPSQSELKRAVLAAFACNVLPPEPAANSNGSKRRQHYLALNGQAQRQITNYFRLKEERGQNPYEGINFGFSTPEPFGYRAEILSYEGEKLWDNGKPPIETGLLIWNRRCQPHNHTCDLVSYRVLPYPVPDAQPVEHDGETYPAGSVIHTIWKYDERGKHPEAEPLEDPNGEIFYVCPKTKKVVPPGQSFELPAHIYHTIEPLPGSSAVTMNAYYPPQDRNNKYFSGRKVPPACQICPSEAARRCDREGLTEKFGRGDGKPLIGGADIRQLLRNVDPQRLESAASIDSPGLKKA